MSAFQMKASFAFHWEVKVPGSGGRVKRHRIHVAWSPVWSFHSQWKLAELCHLVLVHCVFSHRPGHFRALHASFCWQALWRCRFHFPSGLGTCPHCQRYQKLVQWPWCCCAWLASKLTWSEPHRQPVLGIVKRKMRDTRTNNEGELKAAIKATWASITLEQCHMLIASMPCRIDAVIHAKGGPTKYWVHGNTWYILFRSPTFVFKLVLSVDFKN